MLEIPQNTHCDLALANLFILLLLLLKARGWLQAISTSRVTNSLIFNGLVQGENVWGKIMRGQRH